jgi:integrase
MQARYGYPTLVAATLLTFVPYAPIIRLVIAFDGKQYPHRCHTARKTFVGNLYKQVPDPNLIASMSGHVDGSRAFARYRNIDDDMKRRLVEMIN